MTDVQISRLEPLDYGKTGLVVGGRIRVFSDTCRIRQTAADAIKTEGILNLSQSKGMDEFEAIREYLRTALVVPDSYRTHLSVQRFGTRQVRYEVIDTICYTATPAVSSSL